MNPADFICGGYYLVKQFTRPKDIAPELPEVLLTLSNCFTNIGPGAWLLRSWNYSLEESAEDAGVFGVPQDLVVPMLDWCTEDKLNVHPNSFRTATDACEFHRLFVKSKDVAVLGIGLHKQRLDSFRAQLHKDPNRGYGLLEQIDRNELLGLDGQAVGFEPLGFEATMFHSWLCHNAPPEARERLGIGTNAFGLISEFEDAVRVTEHLVAAGAEPAIWDPWLVMRYAP